MKYLFIRRILIWGLALFTLSALNSCKTGEGCQAEEKVHTKKDKNGNPKGKPKSGLFPKNMKKKSR